MNSEMSHDIIDNRDQRLVDHIRQILPGSQAARFAVGYFFLSGLEVLADVFDNVNDLRLLIGNTTSRQTIEQVAEGYRRLEQSTGCLDNDTYPKRSEMTRRTEQTAAQVGQTVAIMGQTDEAEALVGTLEAASRAPITEAVRQELNTLWRAKVNGADLLGVLAHIYHRHNLRDAQRRHPEKGVADDLPAIVCSEGLVSG